MNTQNRYVAPIRLTPAMKAIAKAKGYSQADFRMTLEWLVNHVGNSEASALTVI